ncbi:hypothetical protein [Rhodopila sp.]|jgi:hypothetical protein|uniref:hypothetical protein n=1 Tax=Rhodopila sp. TaxID=2480087 RepID=UPI002CE0F698|nr:hypothetical protein [Rhodopila sp.]HVZ09259.1 hypothetical protein [Rhodopila sp.]
MSTTQAPQARPQSEIALRAVWLGLLVVGGVCSSFFFACATPFAALATLAALKMEWREGIAVVGLVWLANQTIGFALLGYPWTADSLAWGVAIGAASFLALGAAAVFASAQPVRLAVSLPFVASFAVYELALYVAGFGLGAGPDAFSLATVKLVFLVNLGAFVALLALHAVARAVGLPGGAAEGPVLAGSR